MSKIFVDIAKSEFSNKKVASNKDNTEYTIGGTGESYVGIPDILYNQVVFLADTHQIFTRGSMYGSNVDCNVQINTTTSLLTTPELMTKYPSLIPGQMVVCPNISIRYTKLSEQSWVEETIGQVMDVFPITDYSLNGKKCSWSTGSVDLSTKQIIVQYSRGDNSSMTLANILSIGKNITTWTSEEGSNIHMYYTVVMSATSGTVTCTLQVEIVPNKNVSGGVSSSMSRTSVDMSGVDSFIVTLDEVNGLKILSTDKATEYLSKSVSDLATFSDLFDGSSLYIGSCEGATRGYGTYDIINIQDI